MYNFEYVGTMDNSPYLTVPDAIKYRESIGGEVAIGQYCVDLARSGGKRIAEMLETEVMENEEGTLGKCSLAMIRLPLDKEAIKEMVKLAGHELEEYDVGKFVRDWLTMRLVKEHNTFIALTVLYGGAWWMRMSATVYLDLNDFEWAAKVIKEECEKVKKGDFLEWLASRV